MAGMINEIRIRMFLVVLVRKHESLFSQAEYSELIEHAGKLNRLTDARTSTARHTIFQNIETFFNGLSTDVVKSIKQIASHTGTGDFIINLVSVVTESYFTLSLNE